MHIDSLRESGSPLPEPLEGSANVSCGFECLSHRWTHSPQNRFANLKAGTRAPRDHPVIRLRPTIEWWGAQTYLFAQDPIED